MQQVWTAAFVPERGNKLKPLFVVARSPQEARVRFMQLGVNVPAEGWQAYMRITERPYGSGYVGARTRDD